MGKGRTNLVTQLRMSMGHELKTPIVDGVCDKGGMRCALCVTKVVCDVLCVRQRWCVGCVTKVVCDVLCV